MRVTVELTETCSFRVGGEKGVSAFACLKEGKYGLGEEPGGHTGAVG